MSETRRLIEIGRCNCSALRKASRRLSQLYDAALAPSGLRVTQFGVLVEIERRGKTPPTIRELAEALVMDHSTIGQNLRPLERAGLVTLEADARDGRRRRVKLTREGRSRLEAARPLWREVQARFEGRFGERPAAELRATLLTIAREHSFVVADEASSFDL
jgi:DNA-binding MarR family transcriptional regulator